MITLGYLSPGTVSTRFHDSVVDLMLADPRVDSRISLVSGPLISTARCNIIRHFLSFQSKPEWLLMLDSDMSFDSEIAEKFLNVAHEKLRPVVGGLCFGGGRVGTPFPTLYRMTDPVKVGDEVTSVIKNYPKDALCKVDATGAACLFMHRDLLMQMHDQFGTMSDGHENPHPWFAETIYKGHPMGEDWTFCMRLKQMKVPLYVHTGIKLGHVKSQLYDEEFYNLWRKNGR